MYTAVYYEETTAGTITVNSDMVELMKTATDLVINLQKAKKAWFFGDDPAKRIFCVAVNPKVTDVDTERDLIQYDLDLEFYE